LQIYPERIGLFAPQGEKTYKKKKSTMLPQAAIILCISQNMQKKKRKPQAKQHKEPGCAGAPRIHCGCGSAHSRTHYQSALLA
jgi:hypothetical protein